MDKRGGARPGAGRPSKADEIKLIEQLTPLAPIAFDALKNGLEKGDFPFVKLFYEYYAGKPTDRVDLTSNGQTVGQAQEIIIRDYSKK